MTPDYKKWCKRDLWTVSEGAQLIIGLDPVESANHQYMGKGHVPSKAQSHVQSKWAEYTDIVEIAKTSISARTLNPRSPIFRNRGIYMEVRPHEFLIWAKGKGFEIPDELLVILEDPNPEQLDTRERKTLLQIIAVLAAEAKLDLNKHFKSAEVLQKMGATHKLVLPKKSDTIAKKLEEARDIDKTR